MDDVAAFFRRWYAPNNATLAIGGDIDADSTLQWVERWFGSIPRGPEVPGPQPWPVRLTQDAEVVVEDDVQLPELTLIWPTVPRFHPDEEALELLLLALSANKSAVLDRALTIDEVLCSQVLAHHGASEFGG